MRVAVDAASKSPVGRPVARYFGAAAIGLGEEPFKRASGFSAAYEDNMGKAEELSKDK